jgi:hypothetical protein
LYGKFLSTHWVTDCHVTRAAWGLRQSLRIQHLGLKSTVFPRAHCDRQALFLCDRNINTGVRDYHKQYLRSPAAVFGLPFENAAVHIEAAFPHAPSTRVRFTRSIVKVDRKAAAFWYCSLNTNRPIKLASVAYRQFIMRPTEHP